MKIFFNFKLKNGFYHYHIKVIIADKQDIELIRKIIMGDG